MLLGRKRISMQKQDNLKKNYIWNTIGTTFLSFNSLFFMIIVTRINGIQDGGIFSFSYASACIVNAIALFCGRTYQVTDDNKEISESSYVSTRIITSLIAAAIAFLFVLINQYALKKAMVFLVLCLIKCAEALSDVFYGILQKRELLYQAGKSMTYKSIAGLLGFGIIDLISHNLILSCIYLLVLNIAFLFFYEGYLAGKCTKIKYRIKIEECFLLIKKSCYTFLFTLIIMIIINIPRYIIDWKLDSESQAIYGILSMPATFIMLFGQFILQPSLTKLAECYGLKEKKEFHKIVALLMMTIFASLIVILPVAYLLGVPILGIIYNVELSAYRWLLLGVIIGAAFYASSNVLLNALITLRCTKVQLILQVGMLALSIGVSILLIGSMGLTGSILSYMTILILQFISYLALYVIVSARIFKGEIYEKTSTNK